MEERSPKRATRVFSTRRSRPRQALARHHRADAPGRNPTALQTRNELPRGAAAGAREAARHARAALLLGFLATPPQAACESPSGRVARLPGPRAPTRPAHPRSARATPPQAPPAPALTRLSQLEARAPCFQPALCRLPTTARRRHEEPHRTPTPPHSNTRCRRGASAAHARSVPKELPAAIFLPRARGTKTKTAPCL